MAEITACVECSFCTRNDDPGWFGYGYHCRVSGNELDRHETEIPSDCPKGYYKALVQARRSGLHIGLSNRLL